MGFEGSSDPFAFEPYVADAKKHFDQPAEAFPSRQHRWGVQNAYVQSLADMGILGLPAFLAALLVPAFLAVRRGVGDARVLGAALPLLVLGVWNGYGLVAGIPVAALTWLGMKVNTPPPVWFVPASPCDAACAIRFVTSPSIARTTDWFRPLLKVPKYTPAG